MSAPSVHVYDEGLAYELGITTLAGVIVAVVTVAASDVRPLGRGEIAHPRECAGEPIS